MVKKMNNKNILSRHTENSFESIKILLILLMKRILKNLLMGFIYGNNFII